MNEEYKISHSIVYFSFVFIILDIKRTKSIISISYNKNNYNIFGDISNCKFHFDLISSNFEQLKIVKLLNSSIKMNTSKFI